MIPICSNVPAIPERQLLAPHSQVMALIADGVHKKPKGSSPALICSIRLPDCRDKNTHAVKMRQPECNLSQCKAAGSNAESRVAGP